MKKRLALLLLAGTILGASPAVWAESTDTTTEETTDDTTTDALEDGVYTVDFDTDSSMFHVNEAMDGHGTLTVKDGEMTIHITLTSKNIVNLYEGLAADAKEAADSDQEDDKLLEPTLDPVTYSDGYEEEVYGFDVRVPELDEEFDLALLGKKGTWYDHKVIVSNPVKED